jgi:hypothetical protein
MLSHFGGPGQRNRLTGGRFQVIKGIMTYNGTPKGSMDASPAEIQLRARMITLARTFPALRTAPGIEPWRPDDLQAWSNGPASHGQRLTAHFLLSVWDRQLGWELDPFDVMEALHAWDLRHRRAFLEWAAAPWWA